MDKVIFRESDHSYWLGDRQLISVTQLLKKHGLSTNYGAIDREVLRAKAERGTQIHKEIESYIKTAEIGFATKELLDYIDLSEELMLSGIESETVVNNDLVAGTADLMGEINTDKKRYTVLADVKTSAGTDKRAWAWQLSLYERLSGKTFDFLYVFHLGENSKLVAIERIAPEEVDKLLECESKGELYQSKALAVPGELLVAAKAAEAEVKRIETEKKAAELVADELRQKLYGAMESQGIKSFETVDGSMLITFIEPTTRETIDSKLLKSELPDIAKKYTKSSPVKGSIRITLRG